jgi:membrane protein
LGSVLIATLRKQDVLLLKGLFDEASDKKNYIEALMQRYGITLQENGCVFSVGNTERNLYYLVSGSVNLISDDKIQRTITPGQYFGETAILTQQPTASSAIVTSQEAHIIVIYAENIDTMLMDYPSIAMRLLKQLASRLERVSD